MNSVSTVMKSPWERRSQSSVKASVVVMSGCIFIGLFWYGPMVKKGPVVPPAGGFALPGKGLWLDKSAAIAC
jgi:hypothetical protein